VATLNLFVNIQTGELVRSFTDPGSAELPPFYAHDTGLLVRVHPLQPATAKDSSRPFDYVSPGSSSLQVGLGDRNLPPTAGTFHLLDPETRATSGSLTTGARYYIEDFEAGDSFTAAGAASNATGVIFTANGTPPGTWSNGSTLVQICDAISFDVSAATLQAALRAKLTANYVACTVTGEDGGAWTIDRVTAGDVDPLEGIGTALAPDSFVGITSLRDGTATLSERQRVRLIQRPAAYATTSTYFDTYTTVNATVRRTGSATVNEIQRVSLPRDTYGGVWQLTATDLGSGNTTTSATGNISFGQTEDEVEDIINAAFGTDNTVVVTRIDDYTFDIEFSGAYVDKRDAALMTANFAGLDVPVGWETTFSLNTSGVVELLGDDDEATTVFELQQTDGADITTIFQATDATLINDLIDPESVGATEFPGWYTAPEVDAFLALITQRGAVTVSAAGTTEVAVVAGCKWLTYRVTVSAGAGSYTHNIDLAAVSADRHAGDTVKIVLSMPASVNPSIVIRDNTGPTTLHTETGSGTAYARTLFMSWSGTAWEADQ
jgi:hypothetical protein